MRLLLDTNILIWLATDQTALLPYEREAIVAPEAELLVSAVSIFELRIKDRAERRRGHAGLVLSAVQALQFCRDTLIDLVSLSPGDPSVTLDPPSPNYDPFDDMLLAHAQSLGAKLLTRDSVLLTHPLAYQP